MSARHTPGPWFTFANGTCVGGPTGILGNPSGADTAGIAHCGMALRTGDELQANARLIAAAPDMLAALQNLENDDGSVPGHAWAMVQAAITKALGGIA